MPQIKENKKVTSTTPIDILRSKGFSSIPVPATKMPHMVGDLAELETKDLGDLLADYQMWREYSEDVYLGAIAELAEAREEYESVEAQWTIELDPNGMLPATKLKARVKARPNVSSARKRFIEAETYEQLLANKIDTFTNTITVISREISRRSNTGFNRD